ncbi:MAG: ABC transporter ATP-binding protein [Velocimicrobium sp.]
MLEIRKLYKYFNAFPALDGLNLEIKKGELFGFVGPNGAGKTTTMKIVSGLLKADAGMVLVDGINVSKDVKKLKEKIGYMPDFFGVYDNLKVVEYMEFYASIYGIERKREKLLIYELLELVNLLEQSENYVDALSRGMKQRLCLARCLIHDPELLILDEPASGLDPRARFEMKEILMNLNHRGKTIIISSHILPELSQMCSTIGIIQKGTMVLKGTVEEIMQQMNTSNPLMIRVLEGQESIVSLLKNNSLVENIAMKGTDYSIGFNGNKEQEAKLLYSLVQNNIKISSFARQEGTLESLFIQITKEVESDKIEI